MRTDDQKERRKAYLSKNKQQIAEQRKLYYQTHKEKWNFTAQEKQRRKEQTIKRLYGVDIKQREALLEQQCGCCAICGIPESELLQPLNIDHDHITNQVRGLLCRSCNMALGGLQVDECGTYLIEKALAYVRRSHL
jgi:hypothetical protein